uniref:Uncharacterized protein n=1 Tax=Anguilla anguilla TaxID=7936 RepID=A0A0E9XS15_ANGAN
MHIPNLEKSNNNFKGKNCLKIYNCLRYSQNQTNYHPCT